MSKIIVRIMGGIGNQLFCYAAARRLAVANSAELVIDDVSGFVRDHDYRRHCQLNHFNISCRYATSTERLEPASRVRRYIKRSLNRLRPFEERSYIQQEGMNFDSRLLHVRPHARVYLDGYWQSEGYFKDIDVKIRSDLAIKPPQDAVNQSVAERIRSTIAVAIHVRFFDPPGASGISNLPAEYYGRAVAAMEVLVPGAHYFLFSDYPDAARSRIPLSDERVTCVLHNKDEASGYADLWLMSQCQHFIIANSTFSWWGAWLADYRGKHVIASGLEMRQGKMCWGFEGLIPDDWIKL